MKQKILIIGVIIIAFCCVENVLATSLGCGLAIGKEIKLPEPKRPSNLTGKIEVIVNIDTKGNVYSVTSLKGNPILRQRVLEKAVQSKFRPSSINGMPIYSFAKIEYEFVGGKSKANVNLKETSILKEYQELFHSKLICTSVDYKILEYFNKKVSNDSEGKPLLDEYVDIIIIPNEENSDFLDEIKMFDFKIISDDIDYFSGIYGRVSINKALDLVKLNSIKSAFGIKDLDVCDYKLFPYNIAKRENCLSLKKSNPRVAVFYGDVADRIIGFQNPTDSFSKNKVFVQVKFNAEGKLLDAKAVSGNTKYFNQAEKEIIRMTLTPQNINGDLGYAIGLIVYVPNKSTPS